MTRQPANNVAMDGVAYAAIAAAVGTPTYVYSSAHIVSQFHLLKNALKAALPPKKQPLLCYACKANSNLAVLALLRTMGAGLEVVSEGELMRGLKAGFDPAMIVSTGVGKQRGEIAACLKAGIHQINIESLPELAQVNQIAGAMKVTAPVVFRLNPNVSGGGHDKISTGRKQDKFGISAEDVFEGFRMARDMEHVTALGLSMHIGSQVFTVERFKDAFEKLPALVRDLRSEGFRIERLDIGGGFPIQYRDEQMLDLGAYAAWLRDIIVPLGTEIILEPGRYLVGNAGVLLSRVLHVKESGDKKFLILDAAMNDLIRPTLYDAWHGIEAVGRKDEASTLYDIVGPVCETGDTFATARALPTLQAEDLVLIKSAGAYGFSMASNYNTRPLPAEVLVHGNRYDIIRERQSMQDLLALDRVPDWLANT